MSRYIFGAGDRRTTITSRPDGTLVERRESEPVADVVFRTERALATHTVTDALVEELMETLVRTRVALAAGERS